MQPANGIRQSSGPRHRQPIAVVRGELSVGACRVVVVVYGGGSLCAPVGSRGSGAGLRRMAAQGAEKASSKKKTEKKFAAREEAKLLASFMGVMNVMRKQVTCLQGALSYWGQHRAQLINDSVMTIYITLVSSPHHRALFCVSPITDVIPMYTSPATYRLGGDY